MLSFKAVTETNWRNYDLQQPRGSVPVGPIVVMIHMASVWVPFTSESKEAIADYDEIRKEMKLALMECGRKLGTYLRKRLKMRREAERRDVFERYIGEIAQGDQRDQRRRTRRSCTTRCWRRPRSAPRSRTCSSMKRARRSRTKTRRIRRA